PSMPTSSRSTSSRRRPRRRGFCRARSGRMPTACLRSTSWRHSRRSRRAEWPDDSPCGRSAVTSRGVGRARPISDKSTNRSTVRSSEGRPKRMIDLKQVEPYLEQALGDIEIAELPNHSRGKVRDSYDLSERRRIIVASDRLSAFDRVLTTIPLKGQALTQIARFWFDATKDLCPNHIEAYPDPNVAVCRRVTIMPVEVVVRGYLTGTTNTSIWPLYKARQREMYGIRFPEGLRENQALPRAIIT